MPFLSKTVTTPPAADPTALKAISVTDVADGISIFVLSLKSYFYYDSSSAASGDDVTVIVPTAGAGRWLVEQHTFSATDVLLGRSTAGAGIAEDIACTAAGRALIDDANAAAQRTTLGLGTMATQAASAVAITGGTIDAVAITNGTIDGAAITGGSISVPTVTTPLLQGGTGAGDDLGLSSTSHATKGFIDFGTVSISAGMRWDEDNERLSIGSSQNTITIATTAFGANLSSNGNGIELDVLATHYSASAADPAAFIMGRARGTQGSETIVQSGDALGALVAVGYDGTDYANCAAIEFLVDGTPGANDMPGKISFLTSLNGSESLSEHMSITNAGKIQFGTSGGATGMLWDGANDRLSVASNQNTLTISTAGVAAILSSNSTESDLTIVGSHYTAIASNGANLVMTRARGTKGSEAIVQAGDGVASIVGLGYDGTDYATSAVISFSIDGTPGSNDMPGKITFSTTKDGAESATEALSLDSNQHGTFATGVTVTTILSAAQVDVDNVTINGNDISSTSGNLTLTPAAGSAVVIDGGASFDGTILTGLTEATLASIGPRLFFDQTDATANTGLWDFIAIGDQLRLRTVNDADSVVQNIMVIDRTTTVVDSISFPFGDVNITSGNLTIGSTTSGAQLHVYADNAVVDVGGVGILVEQDGTGDAIIAYLTTGVQRWVTGIDNSDSDKYKIASSGDLDTDARFTITTGGSVGLGTPAPDTALHLLSSSDNGIIYNLVNSSATTPFGGIIQFTGASPDDNTRYFLRCNDATTNRLFIYSDGDVLNHDGVYGMISDGKLKRNIVDATPKTDDVMALQVRNFEMLSDAPGRTLIGFVSQEMESVFPGLIMETGDTFFNPETGEQELVMIFNEETNQREPVFTKGIKTSVLTPILVKAFQEQRVAHLSLVDRVAVLELA